MGADLHIIASPSFKISLDVPIPPSVNRTRRIDWRNHNADDFYLRADLYISAHGPKPAPVRKILGAYELKIQVPESSRLDLDNHCKALIDYLVKREFVGGDSKRYLRRLIIEWGSPSAVCRVTITETS